ncbi:glutamate carboxypeptidase [Providencia alcalifaciens]|nr:glutamate carboxypeptidase [Providencia alcalifaciens]
MNNNFLVHQADMLKLLEEVVNIESGSYDKFGVDQHSAIWCERYKKMGFEVEVIPNESLGNNYRIYYPTEASEILILLHLDTVFPKGTVAERPFSIEGDRAYGPGVIDMKGSHVMVYQVIKELFDSQDPRYKKIEVLLNCDEEIGSISSREIIEKCALGKRYALVMEPARANGAIVSARRGVGTYVLTIQGKASHSGIAPEAGISAIQELAHKIQSLHALSQHDKGLSVNVGLISGGTSVNTVAPNARAEIDVRISTDQQGVKIDKKVRDICNTPVLEGIQLSLTGGINRPPMVKTNESTALISIIKEEATQLNITLEDVSTGGGSDASFTAGVGTPTVDGLGPIGGHQHSDKEYLEIPSLAERAQLFFNVLKRITQ